MRKAIVALGVLLLVAFAVPAVAQGPFADVPTDHWAYRAVNDLQQKGVLLGYPDGTFSGRRAITRYEFAVAIARMIPVIVGMVPSAQGGVSQADMDALKERVAALERKPGGPGGVSQEDLNTVRRLVDQFKDELASLGVDVETLKRDVANLAERVSALEAKVGTVTWTGAFDVFGIATKQSTGTPVDRDNRTIPGPTPDDFLNSTGVLFDGDLNLRARVSDMATAAATINFGNYLNYIGFVDNFIAGVDPSLGFVPVPVRPISKATGLTEEFFPYYVYVDAGFGSGSIKAGRLPLQFTPYTMKLIDVDTYTMNTKTDSGDYPIDGAKLDWKAGPVSVMAYAAKHNSNEHLALGLTSQANGGLYLNGVNGPFVLTGHAAAGGVEMVDQSAGIRAMLGTPYKANFGVTFIRVAGQPSSIGATTYDQADVLGADVKVPISKVNVGLEYAQTSTLKASGPGGDIDSDNKAWDGQVGLNLGSVGVDVGYRQVERNFTAPGYWDRLGRWANPSNITGPYLDAKYGISSKLKLMASGAFYKGADSFVGLGLPPALDQTGDDLWRAAGGLKWGITPSWSVDAKYEMIRWSPNEGGDSDETYLTFGAKWQINPSAGLKLAYQIIDYSPEGAAAPYGTSDYKGDLAVAEFGVKF